MSRTAHRKDANQDAIVLAFHHFGCQVQSLAGVGKGCPDLLVNHKGTLLLVEVKHGNKRRTKPQREWHELWETAPVFIARNLEDVPKILGVNPRREAA